MASLPQPNSALLRAKTVRTPTPPYRRLHAYAFDPSLSDLVSTVRVNQIAMKVQWEEELQPGPVGEYVEVVDYDPASQCFYAPVNLNDPHLLAQDGLYPSEGNPQFHQQMVYAVTMTTIRNFERALGRRAFWAPGPRKPDGTSGTGGFVRRLRVYPHALREANAYYSRRKVALLFGYFPASHSIEGQLLPGGTVYTCLSQDIVAHETSHALLDGMHGRFQDPSNGDAHAFHEAFADIVALFQHFTFPEVLQHQIAQTRGDLASQNLLVELAQQFGRATGSYSALRDAIGEVDSATRQWKRTPADPDRPRRESEPHARGSLLVAAIFDAFLAIYLKRSADLLRIATEGTGVLPAGQLHPDLVNRLAGEAAIAAKHVLTMCIRALDYCPPVDLTFGDYLRALITADYEMVPDDKLDYRVAVREAFRRYGIFPQGMRSLSVNALIWQPPTDTAELEQFCRDFFVHHASELARMWDIAHSREAAYYKIAAMRENLHGALEAWLRKREPKTITGLEEMCGLDLQPDSKFQVYSLNPVHRVGPDGNLLSDIVIELIQRKRMRYDNTVKGVVEVTDAGNSVGSNAATWADQEFTFRGGCTLIIDLSTAKVKYVIQKGIGDTLRMQRQWKFESKGDMSLRATYFEESHTADTWNEPFAFIHRTATQDGWT